MNDEQTQILRDIWNQMKSLATKAEMNARFDKTDARLDRMDTRFDRMDARFDRVEGEIKLLRTDVDELKTSVRELRKDVAGLEIDGRAQRLAISAMNIELVEVKTGIEAFKRYVELELAAVRRAIQPGMRDPDRPA